MSSISYAITVWNEDKELDRLLHKLKSVLKDTDEIIVQMDTKATNEVKQVVKNHGLAENIFAINDSFVTFKNNLNKLCTKDYIFQIDGDEFLSDKLLNDIDNILEVDSDVDAFIIPRINVLVDKSKIEDYINNSEWENNEIDWINYPDGQTRLFKNKSEIVWGGDRIHTHLVDLETTKELEKGYYIIHIKSFERQDFQNEFYETF